MKPLHKRKTVFDLAGFEFEVLGFTHDLEGAISGFHLKNPRGEKEIALSDWRFYKQRKPRKTKKRRR